MSTLTVNSNSGGDGTIYGTGATYATAHDATSGTVTKTSATDVIAQNDKVSSTEWYVRRAFYPFDTSALGSSAVITAATFRWYFYNGTNPTTLNPNADSISLVQSSQASGTDLVAADFDNVGTTKGATDILRSTMSASAGYLEMSLNSTGLTWINKTGYTFLCLRSANDIANSAPTGRSFVDGSNFSNSSTNKPELVITYSIPSGPTNLKSYNTNLKANIKSINTNPIANVKSLDTNA
jgi:hypothetical protein